LALEVDILGMEEKGTSQQLISLDTIRDGILILKNKGLRAVLEAEGMNFDLKSSEEKQGIINAFQELLTTIDFPLQAMVYSKKANIDTYISSIQSLKEKEQNELLQAQMTDYVNFLTALLEQNNIMSKRFFVIVPFQLQALKASFLGALNPLASATPQQPAHTDEEFIRHSEQLAARTNMVSSALNSIGIENRQLNTEELVELFYNLYNPQEKEIKQ